MRYHGTVIRPPSEADSLIIQVTYGCSHNSCDFCGTYLDKPFRVRPFQEVVEDVRSLPDELKSTVTKVFLGDGDAVIPVSYTHLRAHETKANLVCRLLLEKKKKQ